MRNLFDQYEHPENRLSHALAVCLHEDRDLLKQFFLLIGVDPSKLAERLVIDEQSLPGETPISEDEAERRSLPDIVIHDNEAWSVLIESKVQAGLTADQLDRHLKTLRKRGFSTSHRLALAKEGVTPPPGVIGLTWPKLYEWLGSRGGVHAWARRMRDYLRVAEVRMARDGYLTEGTLTMFDGFPFSDDNPYTYGEAKRLLSLALKELRKDRSLCKMGIDPDAEGRHAITGRAGASVWDFLSLKGRPASGGHTRYPHLTLAIHAEMLEVAITIPHGVITNVRTRLADLGTDGLCAMNGEILEQTRNLRRIGSRVEAYALQRHYKSQRSAATKDASVYFRLETSQSGGDGRTKHQPEWAALLATLLKSKRSNIQFGYVVSFPWSTDGIKTRKALSLISEGWCALEPLLNRVRGRKPG